MQKKWTFCNSIFRKWAFVSAHSTLSLPKVGLLVPITIRPNSNNWLCWSSPQSLSWLWRPYIRQREAIQCQRGPDWHSSDLGDHIHMAHRGHCHGYKSEIIHVHMAHGGYCHVNKCEKNINASKGGIPSPNPNIKLQGKPIWRTNWFYILFFQGEHKKEYREMGTNESSNMKVIMRQRMVGEEMVLRITWGGKQSGWYKRQSCRRWWWWGEGGRKGELSHPW